MAKYRLMVSEGHLITIIGNDNYIIDTGTTTSYSCSGSKDLSIGEYDFFLQQWPFPYSGEIISKLVHLPVAGLIGLDIMEKLGTVEISKQGGYVLFGESLTAEGDELPFILEGYRGLKVITTNLMVNGKRAKVILDTGARIDYLDTALLDTSEVVRHEKDFNPIIGKIEVDGYRSIYGIGDREFATISYAATNVLKQYVSVLNISDLSGVIGLNAFLDSMKSIAFDFRNRKLVFQA